MPEMTPEQEASHALDAEVARSELSKEAQLAYDRLVEQRARAAPPAPVSRAVVVDSVRLAEKNMREFAVTSWHDRLYFAWVPSGRTYRINLAYSPDGREITGKQQLAQRSQGLWGSFVPSPSLAVSGGQLYLAWTGTDVRINVLADPENPHGVPVLLEANSHHTLALCSHQGGLVMAWTDHDGRINILPDPQSPTRVPTRLDEPRSRTGPALYSHHDGLILAWCGKDRHINIWADPESPHGAPVRLEEAKSREMPALCSHQGRLVLAWTDHDHLINILADPQSPARALTRLDAARSRFAPALCSHQDGLILTWCGEDRYLNLTRLELMQA